MWKDHLSRINAASKCPATLAHEYPASDFPWPKHPNGERCYFHDVDGEPITENRYAYTLGHLWTAAALNLNADAFKSWCEDVKEFYSHV